MGPSTYIHNCVLKSLALTTHSITRERTEIVLEGTFNSSYGEDAGWLEVEFKCKPGAIGRRPCFVSPYHYRLDWLMWFAAFQVCVCVCV